MVVSPVIIHSLEVVGRHADHGRGPACLLCEQPKLGGDHRVDCGVRQALNRPADLDLARAALEQVAVCNIDDEGKARCGICLTAPGLRHELSCVVGHGLFTIECLERLAG